MQSHKHKATIFGGAMIIAGTAIGAGMFANPTATAGIWFSWSLLVFIYTWFCMWASGLMILEANIHYPSRSSFSTIVQDLLGPGWNIINGLSIAFVLYILLYAYITSGGGLTANYFNQVTSLNIGQSLGSFIFCVIFAFFVWLSTKAVDRMSTILIGGMVITFLLSMGDLLANVQMPILFNSVAQGEQSYLPYILVALPACLVSFGYHGNVPSLVKYFNGDIKKVVQAITLGSVLALTIYLLWQFAIHGNLPRSEFAPVIAKDGDISILLSVLSAYIETGLVAKMLNAFAYMALTSSFLGVALGLFDYISDLFKFDDSIMGRTKATFMTFLPPLLFSLNAPFGFVTAIGFAGLAATIWAAIVPALLAQASRKRFPNAPYRVFGGQFMIYFVISFGVLNIIAQIGIKLGWFPVFMG
ncbi:aromatic amino acid transporter [Moraxella sp. ZY210820]|uniref:aromatic amino acid transporter n=1 Tax=unclassified Moraxella TaxID=2685852 RepID=UPI002731E1E6|nr:aromatic amino acid transporter [Moraxella sp. ZY210820]WLF83421.1 aromatic amino acid transporter [Moraxella sp. ZY210820]